MWGTGAFADFGLYGATYCRVLNKSCPRNQRCLKPGSLGAGLFACRQSQHFRQLALEVDAQFIAIGHEADLVDEPTNYLTGFLPRFLGVERLSQVIYLLSANFGEVGVQVDGWRRFGCKLLLNRPLVPFEALELSLQGVRQNAGLDRCDQRFKFLVYFG